MCGGREIVLRFFDDDSGEPRYVERHSEGAVGPDHYVQGVNISFRIFDKQGEPLLTERTQVSGTGSLTGSARLGDYSSMEFDPVDSCTFWFTGEYVETSGPSTWSTRIGAFRVPGRTGGLRPPPGEDDVAPVAED